MSAACTSSSFKLMVNTVHTHMCVCSSPDVCVFNFVYTRIYVCVRSLVSLKFQGEQINWQSFAIIDFYHTHKNILTHFEHMHLVHTACTHISLAFPDMRVHTHTRCSLTTKSWEEGGMMKRIQNSIDCVLVLSRRHKVYCTVRGHKTLTLHQKKKEGGKK